MGGAHCLIKEDTVAHGLLDDMGCQAGVIAANLTTIMTEDKTKTTKSYDTIKLGIDVHAKW